MMTSPRVSAIFRLGLSALVLISILLVWVPSFAVRLQPKLLDFESYGESYTAIADLKDGTYVLTQFVFTNAGFGDGKAACRALVVDPKGRGMNEALRFSRSEWRYMARKNVLQVGQCHLSSAGGKTVFSVKTKTLKVDLLFDSGVQAITPPGHRISVDDDEFFSSRILLPWGTLTAVIKSKTDLRSETGFGYLDHTLSNTRLPKVADRWIRIRGFYGSKKALLELRYPPKSRRAKGWIYTDKSTMPKGLSIGGSYLNPNDKALSFSVDTPDGKVRIETTQVLYRYRPAKEWGLLGKLAKPWVGDPKTTTFRVKLTWTDGTVTKGILEQAAIRDE